MLTPMYGLLISPSAKERQAIQEGRMSISIRDGHRDYRAGGQLLIGCPTEPWIVLATVTHVRHVTIAATSSSELRDAGYRNPVDALAKLVRFYPELSMRSPITIIRWNNVRGFFVDHSKQYRANPSALYRSIPQR